VGLHSSPVPWLAPPLVGAARAAATGLTTGPALVLAVHALLWGAAGVGGYVWLRRYRG